MECREELLVLLQFDNNAVKTKQIRNLGNVGTRKAHREGRPSESRLFAYIL